MSAAAIAITHPQRHGPLVAIQELDGRTVFVDEASFTRAGLVGPDILGISWMDFTPPDEHATELALIDEVLRTGMPAFPRVVRQWPGGTVNLISKTSALVTKGGTQLLMREARIVDPAAGLPIDLQLDAQGPFAQIDALAVIDQMLSAAAGLAAREHWRMLRYVIEMARQQAHEQQVEINKAVLS